MKVAIIGRSELLFESVKKLHKAGHVITSVLTAKATPEYTKNEKDFKHLAEQLNVPFECTSKIKKQGSFLQSGNPDIAVSVNYSGIIPSDIIDLFPHGILNAHGGDLPRYRGNACQAWAILNGEERIGLCIHKMIADELDNGDVFCRKHLPITDDTKIAEVYEWMIIEIPKMFLQVVTNISKNPDLKGEKQSSDPQKILRCYPRNPDDGRIDWNRTSTQIQRLINASGPPFQGAFGFMDQKKIYIFDSEKISDQERFLAIPGQVLKIEDDGVTIACRNGKIKIKNFLVDGKKLKSFDVFTSLRQRMN